MNRTIFRPVFSLLTALFLTLGLLMFCPVKASASGWTMDDAPYITISGSSGNDAIYTENWSIEEADKEHFVRAMIPARGLLSIEVFGEDDSTAPFPMALAVYSGDGKPIWSLRTGNASSAGGTKHFYEMLVDADIYYIGMQADMRSTSFPQNKVPAIRYRISFRAVGNEEIEPNDIPESALSLQRGGLHRGYVGGLKNYDGSPDTKDFWSFEAEAGHSYRMVFTQQGINGTDVKAYVTQPGAKLNTKTPLSCQRRTKDGHLFVDVPISTSGTAYLMFCYDGERTPYAIRIFDLTDHNLVEEKGRWNQRNGKWIYLDSLDVPVTGWRYINRKWYYFDKSGVMQTGWLCENGKWYYLDSSGIMTTGWKYLNGRWYYLNTSGVMVTGWYTVRGDKYYFDSSGAMKTGWQYVDGQWYYLSSSGARYKGWLQSGSKWYYLAPHMLENETMTIDGHDYHFDSSGYMSTGWVLENGKWYYYSPASGRKCIGWMQIGGKWYYLDGSRNGAMVSGEWLKIGGTYYQFSADGAWVA